MFDPVDPKQSFPDLENGLVAYWQEEDTFRRSLKNREGRENFSFYDGPPFATGLPHYGHLLAGTVKDVIPRYQTMRGKYVERRFGWDCHGLPIENLIEKEHEIQSKQDIEAMGIDRFNDLCRSSVQRYATEWRQTVERMGRWVDMDHDYKTMDPDYMESIWWVFKSLFDKNMIYEGHKPMHVCPRCVTPLSNFEVTQAYKDITDQSAIVAFTLKDEPNTYLLAWTTTPWTLPGNVFIAVHPDTSYAFIEHENSTYIVAEERAEHVFKDKEFSIKKAVKGSELIGKTYTPLFSYFEDEYRNNGFKIVAGDFVTTDDGTGLVHIAPGFGEDDFAIGEREKVPLLQHVTMQGKFTPDVTDFAGMDVKPKDDPTKTDKLVIKFLEQNGALFSAISYRHSYPHCWRCDSPLLNYATSSWFVRVEDMRDCMLEANAKTRWVPAHIRDGRFGKWLENARDWAISRNRYWGTPLPIWRSEDGSDVDVIMGRDDLMQHHRLRFTKITSVRHGEAEHNVGKFFQSEIPGVSLTKKGEQEAAAAGTFLQTQNVDVIYSSPLARALETAQAIADATGAEVVVDERLRETEAREHEGKTYDLDDLLLMKAKRKEKRDHKMPEGIYHLDGMETWNEMFDRISNFMDEKLPLHRSDHIVIVSHGDPLRIVEQYITKEDAYKLSNRAMPANAVPTQFFWDHDRNAEMDLHKDSIDSIAWPSSKSNQSVDVTIVRHGETNLNKDQIMQGGNVDEPLNDTGRSQAAETAKQLKNEKYDVIISSDLKRAAETADIIAKELGMKDVIQMEEMRERHAGTWSGRPRADIFKEHPAVTENMNVAFHYATPPEGESLAAFMERMTKLYNKIVQEFAGKKVLIVAHGGVVQGVRSIVYNLPYKEIVGTSSKNGEALTCTFSPLMRRIPEVLDCWFESGSAPYALQHYPFEASHHALASSSAEGQEDGKASSGESSAESHLPHDTLAPPPAFPADFIAENLDQTRGWFYTLMVLSTALFDQPAFNNCICGGIVLAEDGRKMSKKLKNYPDPNELMNKHGADALRFALMSSPVVRAETLRFSEKTVEEVVQRVLLPLWNSYSFFVTYANLAHFTPSPKARTSNHPLDRWLRAEVQSLVNRMTDQLDAYDLSGTCAELHDTIDALTNWYIRLSRRRFAGKSSTDGHAEAIPAMFTEDQHDALTTLHNALITLCQLLAPFCPFITEAIYLNLSGEDHGSIHLTDWPAYIPLSKEETALIEKTRFLRTITSLGLKIRSDANVKVRTPLARATIALPPSHVGASDFSDAEIALLRQELNVKEVEWTNDPGSIAEAIVMVDARKAGPRFGKKVQELINAGKNGEYDVQPDGRIVINDEVLEPEEAQLMYRGKEGENVGADRGVVVSLDTTMTKELELEGAARDLIRAIQKFRKEQGYELGATINIGLDAKLDPVLAVHKDLIEQETIVRIGKQEGTKHAIVIGDDTFDLFASQAA